MDSFCTLLHIILPEGVLFMKITLEEIRRKAVVNMLDGACFGYADDLIADTETKQVLALLIKGRLKLFGILGREDDVLIPWEKIDTIGQDTILVRAENVTESAGRFSGGGGIIEKILGIFGITR